MAISNSTDAQWFETVHSYTERLVHIRSVSPSTEENLVAQEVLKLLHADGLETAYAASGLDPVAGDPYGRHNVYALLRGASSATLILLGHIDTVDTIDYGTLEELALRPAELTSYLKRQEDAQVEQSGDWLFGRGTVDMKAGVAVNIALLRHLAREASTRPLPLSILLLATVDEENESAGVLQAIHFLSQLRERYGLHYIGAINTDYTTSLYPGDPHRYIYAGAVGKLLPSFLCIGCESHAGTPFNGLDANLIAAQLISEFSMNDMFCDIAHGQCTAPPVTLHASDLKDHYDVQLPLAAYFYLNVLTITTSADALLERLQRRAQEILDKLLRHIDATEQRWLAASGAQERQQRRSPRSGTVVTYAELYSETVQRLGREAVERTLADEWARCPLTLDKRQRSLRLTHALWRVSGRQGPAVVIYYSPPYYPHVAAASGALYDAITVTIEAHPEHHLEMREYYPYLSDISYLRLDSVTDLTTLKANMPVWQDNAVPQQGGAYNLPLGAIRTLNIPVVNWGPHGKGAHQRDEGLLMSYSFGILPQLLYETVHRLSEDALEQ